MPYSQKYTPPHCFSCKFADWKVVLTLASILSVYVCYRFEGIVVAKEFEDVLLDAWRADEEETRRKENEVCKLITSVFF